MVKSHGQSLRLTQKQADFAQAYVETGNASEAYRQTYTVAKTTKPESIWESSSKLLSNPKVASRVAELQAEHRERHNVSVDVIGRQLDEDRALARKLGNTSAAVSASMGKAKLYGLLTDRAEVTSKNDTPQEKKISDLEIARRLAFLLRKGAE